ncbi:MAG: glycine cleavage system protein GcvH [Candidatus Hodarchaeota archaeon]
MDYKFPDNLKYTSSHEWVKIEEDVAIVGITDYAQHQLGDIVFVQLPDLGISVERETSVGEIESVKAVGDLIMPLSGEIIEINEKLADNPELVNTSPFEEGWILKVKFSNHEEINNLLSVNKYKELVQSEEKK